jgi:hypothetical protein
MSDGRDDGGSAFPILENSYGLHPSTGMSLRDYAILKLWPTFIEMNYGQSTHGPVKTLEETMTYVDHFLKAREGRQS